jgi:hypothetical protein
VVRAEAAGGVGEATDAAIISYGGNLRIRITVRMT